MNRFIFLTMILRADGTVATNSGMQFMSYIVYLEIYVVPIGHGFSFFWSWKSHGKSMLKKRGHPERGAYLPLGLEPVGGEPLMSVPKLHDFPWPGGDPALYTLLWSMVDFTFTFHQLCKASNALYRLVPGKKRKFF